jgi:D-glycero-D-manno-heptose 1,7-bisphosphate phosphatase
VRPPGRTPYQTMSRWSAIFLDRDGTVNVAAAEGAYVTDPDQVVLLPGVAEAIGRLRNAAVPVFVVTNQRGVARGLMTPAALDAVNERVRSILARDGVSLDGIYCCMHEAGACDCRKPLPGLLRQVVRDHRGVKLARCAMVGDAATDVLAGSAAGCTTVRLAAQHDPLATITVGSLPEAVSWLLS